MAAPRAPPTVLPAGVTWAQSANPHSSQPPSRGFVLRGLSDAGKRPKLFTKAECQLSGRDPRKLPFSRYRTDRQISRVQSRPDRAMNKTLRACRDADRRSWHLELAVCCATPALRT